MEFEVISSVEHLRELYDTPMDLVIKKQQSKLDQYSTQFLELSPFVILSTSNARGSMDCSPRGDFPGFIQILDENTIAIPDRPGNNRLDSLSNIVENPNVGILALIPGFKECLRVNGEAKIVTNVGLLKRFEYQGKLPKTVIVVSIAETFFHCAKAITRSKIWKVEAQAERNIMPSLGEILTKQIDPLKSEGEIKKVEEIIENRVKTTLY
ncbi:pyridoxamine 5'-phosphate oxidase family protein [Gilvimarinus sp. SDUM040013]|uniref:Pyridoxamine 5'-phosphate oxidase family protein n=1 Tax=Gilvimarinus gilvus TaxID=3058038 RepID=A0ABU4S688_9GAMM|nr:pyridoxamine 5'-phosphate oxidase family protein [Gilvimarinus sp. SDUM040013]MDO3388043.1 pyridoxamine 5'-phosphate oxidase family protein [Gilvimarinus sp. SDUM040013]MDX6851418.1 pyridoxamine 5'-phosphate oxidase family protein [Gilvimarinus sp. SDUM040013]